MARCYVCSEEVSVPHEHHVIPQAYGGKDGPTVTLCANHHNLIHELAKAHMSGKPIDAKWRTPLERERGATLALAIVQAQQKSKDREFKIVYKISLEHRRRLGELKKRLGFTSLEKTIDFCVKRAMREQGII